MTVTVGGTIAAEARGAVSVKVGLRVQGRHATVTKRVQILGGRWSVRLVFVGIDRNRNAAINVSTRFAGSPGVQGGHVERGIGRLRT